MTGISHKQKLIDYFKKNLSKGYTEESLTWALVNQGYTRTDISRAIDQAKKEIEEKKQKEKDYEKPVIRREFYDVENKPIGVEKRKPSAIRDFFNRLFSR